MRVCCPLPVAAQGAQLAQADAASAAHPLVDRNLLGGRRRVPPAPTRHLKGRGFDDGPVEKPVEAPGAREKAQDASWSATGETRGAAGNRMLTPFARRSAAIADAPETPGCLGSGLASKPSLGRLAGYDETGPAWSLPTKPMPAGDPSAARQHWCPVWLSRPGGGGPTRVRHAGQRGCGVNGLTEQAPDVL
jgi:hypothetical protein